MSPSLDELLDDRYGAKGATVLLEILQAGPDLDQQHGPSIETVLGFA